MGNIVSYTYLRTMEPEDFTNRGVSSLRLFDRTGDTKDLGEAVMNFERALELTPDVHQKRAIRLSNLASSLTARFQRIGNMADIDDSILRLQEAIGMTRESQAEYLDMLNNLGNAYGLRFKRTGSIQDLDFAISNHRKAVDASSFVRPIWFTNLGTSHLYKFLRVGDLQDANSAILYHQKAIDNTPPGHEDLAGFLNNLGYSHWCRFEHTASLNDLDLSIVHYHKAIDSSPTLDADLFSWFSNLGNSYTRRFQHTGNTLDIDNAIDSHQKAADSMPVGHAEFSVVSSNLGCSYSSRFERTGDLQDIDLAISHHQKAVVSTPAGHADLSRRFTNLGNSYAHRFQRTQNIEDIKCAVSYHQKAVDHTIPGHTDLPRWLCNLGNSYAGLFDVTGHTHDLECAITHQEAAIALTVNGHADFARRLSNVANSYTRHFELTGDINDIKQAILCHRKAIDLTPSGHSHLPHRFSDLGTSYTSLFDRTGVTQYLDYAISHYETAVNYTPAGHTDLPSLLGNLANACLLRYENIKESSDVQRGITLYRRGAAAKGFPSTRLHCAIKAATLAAIHDRPQCLADFSLSIRLLSEVAGLEQTVHRRHNSLHSYSELISSAVSVALDLGKSDLALEWLEQGRCLVWSQLNQLRTPVDRLQEKNKNLAAEFTRVARELEYHSTQFQSLSPSSFETLPNDLHIHDATLSHTRLAGEYKTLLEKIRSIPEFDDFLQPTESAKIVSLLPPDGPIIIFNLHATRCDALVLSEGMDYPLHIPLQDFSLAQATKLQQILETGVLGQRDAQQDRASRPYQEHPEPIKFILEELWHRVVSPIIVALAYTLPVVTQKRTRIWWCPTGPLSFLPLHAAGIYGSRYRAGLRVFDFVVSSYTPTVQSIKEKYAALCPPSISTKLLLVSQPNTPGLPPIRWTKTEIHELECLMERNKVYTHMLEDAAATKEKVTSEMISYRWAHFACHGIQDRTQALESGLCLHDGRLDLLEIMKQRIPQPEMVFLSACQTSKGDASLAEEVVHFAAGMLAAGYRGVIATMWNISDAHGPQFAAHFYQYLLEDKESRGLDSTHAAYALDYATRMVWSNLKDGERAFMTWIPYVHFGY